MIGLDTSFLVGLSIREHPTHSRCWEVFESEIRGHEASVGLSSQVLTEFAHVVTDPRRFSSPLSMPHGQLVDTHSPPLAPITAQVDRSTREASGRAVRGLARGPRVAGALRSYSLTRGLMSIH